ncbi:MAG: phosphotransferase [Bacilli bacterium]|nr:phosphotransferase [Bacilli bacterium]
MELQFEQKDSGLIVFVPEKIDTTNADEIEEAAKRLLAGREISSLTLDAEKTRYVSSVGLRLVLKLQRAHPNFSIINCSPDVYEIFDMTGFTKILDIKKALREISIAGCPLLGQGAYGRVYRIDGDTILKSFYRGNPISDIDRERLLAREAFMLGIPTAISFDIVKVKEECYGAVYELINSDSLLSCFQKHPEDYEKYLNLYIDLLNKLHGIHSENEKIPTFRSDLVERLGRIKGKVKEELYRQIESRVLSFPDKNALIHGDCHFKNVFSTPDGLILIDMDTLMRGDPLAEMANLHRTYVGFDVVEEGNIEKFMHVDGAFCKKLYEDLLDRLYGQEKEETQKKISFLSFFLLLSHYASKKEKCEKEFAKCEGIVASLLADFDHF